MSIDTSNLENISHGAKNPTAVMDAFRSISAEPSSDSHAQVSKNDLSAPFVRPSSEEAALVASLRDAALAKSDISVAHADDFWLLACIRARKGDIPRAMALAHNYIQWRLSLRSEQMNLAQSPKMRAQLERRIVFVTGDTDRSGRPIVNVRMRNQDPSAFAAIDTTRTLSFVLEWTLRTYPAAQTHGVVIVNDFAGVTLRNLDLRLPAVIQRAFSRTIPVRVAALNVINPPLFMKVIFVIAGAVLSQKLKARVSLFSKGDESRLEQLIEKEHIMEDLGMGGTAQWTDEMHRDWIDRMQRDCQTWAPCTSYIVDDSS